MSTDITPQKPKVPKGTRDLSPQQLTIRETALRIITNAFKRHGAVAIDTPVFELRDTLTGKYGEDSKLVYHLADQGGELLSLRYDLTVPFARYVSTHNVHNIKRYQVGKVYRRDQPQMNKGRFREFYQCDFDIAGSYPTMVADSEVVKVLIEVLHDLNVGEFEIKINHRKLLDAVMYAAGVPTEKHKTICSAIDKLDKMSWENVRKEMIDEKGLEPEVADRLRKLVLLRGEPMRILDELSVMGHELAQNTLAKTAFHELRILFNFLKAMNALQYVILDLSLARGLDYYTGLIYEATLKNTNGGGGVGSIAAGGRYDTLIEMFGGKNVPAVGVSIGVERVFAILETKINQNKEKAPREKETEVWVASIGENMQIKRMEIANILWSHDIKTEFGFKQNPTMADQLKWTIQQGIPFMVLFGEDEIKNNCIKIKDIGNKKEYTVQMNELVPELQTHIVEWKNQVY